MPEIDYPWPLGGATHQKTRSKPPMILDPLTEDQWEALDGKARWDSIVALRGPDLINSECLKYFTTAVIRYRLSKVMRVGGMVNRTIPFVVLAKDEHGGSSKFDVGHFYHHIQEAAKWLTVPILGCSGEIWNEMLKNTPYYEVLNHLREDFHESSPGRAFLNWHLRRSEHD